MLTFSRELLLLPVSEHPLGPRLCHKLLAECKAKSQGNARTAAREADKTPCAQLEEDWSGNE